MFFCKLIFSNKFGFILETVFSYTNNTIGEAESLRKL
jgi:hypothetical protein